MYWNLNERSKHSEKEFYLTLQQQLVMTGIHKWAVPNFTITLHFLLKFLLSPYCWKVDAGQHEATKARCRSHAHQDEPPLPSGCLRLKKLTVVSWLSLTGAFLPTARPAFSTLWDPDMSVLPSIILFCSLL